MRSVLVAGVQQAKHEGKILIILSFMAIIVVAFVLDPFQRVYDKTFRDRPFVSATIEILNSHTSPPDILYLATAPSPAVGRWSAWVDVDGKRICGGSGHSGYGPPKGVPQVWGWAEFLGRDCAVPEVPFRLCSRYVVSLETGVSDVSGPFCSAIYPTQKKIWPRGR